jgi:hypothetical protein
MFGFEPSEFVPFMIFSIPIIAVVGGLTLAIVRALGRQRLVELAQQERIAAIQRGIEPSKLPPLPIMAEDDDLAPGISGAERDRRRSQGLLIGGVVTLATGVGLSLFLAVIQNDERVWAVGLIPGMIGLALLLSAWIVAPKGGQR